MGAYQQLHKKRSCKPTSARGGHPKRPAWRHAGPVLPPEPGPAHQHTHHLQTNMAATPANPPRTLVNHPREERQPKLATTPLTTTPGTITVGTACHGPDPTAAAPAAAAATTAAAPAQRPRAQQLLQEALCLAPATRKLCLRRLPNESQRLRPSGGHARSSLKALCRLPHEGFVSL